MKKSEKKEITLASLKKIYEELPKLAETKPTIKAEFDMQSYGVYSDLKKKEFETECMTFGCGLGNSAFLFDIDKTDFYYGKFDYNKFGKRILPSCYLSGKPSFETKKEDLLWSFLFSSSWSCYQPKFEQFIERVKYAIDMDLEIGDWQYQKASFVK